MSYVTIMRAALGKASMAAKKGAKVKGFKAKEAFRVGKGKLKYKTATKFPGATAKAKKTSSALAAGFNTFAKSKTGRHIANYRATYASGATALGYEATKNRKA